LKEDSLSPYKADADALHVPLLQGSDVAIPAGATKPSTRCHGSRQKLAEPLSPNRFEGGRILMLYMTPSFKELMWPSLLGRLNLPLPPSQVRGRVQQ